MQTVEEAVDEFRRLTMGCGLSGHQRASVDNAVGRVIKQLLDCRVAEANVVFAFMSKICGQDNKIEYNSRAAIDWVAGEVAAGRLEDIPRTGAEIKELFTPENVLKHAQMTGGEPRRFLDFSGL